MKVKLIGLGKMGMNLALNLSDKGIKVVGFDVSEEAILKAKDNNLEVADSLDEMMSKNEMNFVFAMLPAGEITKSALYKLIDLSNPGDILIDGGNSNYKDSIEISKKANEKGIYFFDIGTSGGVYGARNGASFMCGGDLDTFKKYVEPILVKISTDNGCLYCGKSGSGHYLKMVHNAMLYGYMQTIGEGFELLKESEFDYNLQKVADSLSKSSVIRGWLLELVANSLEKNPDLEGIKGVISASKTTNWTIDSALELGVPTPVISMALMMRLRSKQNDSFSAKLIASLRDEVGGNKPLKK